MMIKQGSRNHLTRSELRSFLVIFLVIVFMNGIHAQSTKEADKLFQKFYQLQWKEVLRDDGTGDWQEAWVLDGERGTVKNTPDGMVFSAGPVFGDHGSHCVLWTREEFEGDLKIEFDYTRLDDIKKAVNIIYIQATGIGDAPYVENVLEWSRLRVVPYMSLYFRYMNLLHISYAAFPPNQGEPVDYVRARRYPVEAGKNFSEDTKILPDYHNTGLFKPGIRYHFTFIKTEQSLFFQVISDDSERLFFWNISNIEPVKKGRIGIRHMYTRAARYSNFTISKALR